MKTNKKLIVRFVICVFIAVVCTFFSLIIYKYVFYKPPCIDSKYCYMSNPDSTRSFVMGALSLEKEYEVIAYYYCDYYSKKGSILGDGIVYHNDPNTRVGVIEYSRDSLIAMIRYEYYSNQRGGMYVTNEFYVPSFTLHSYPLE